MSSIRFHLLGPVALTAPDGRRLDSVLAQPKRVAVLAYLALATPRGFQRRDTLLALFWPELEEARARNALSKAIHHLRRSLGDDVIEARGADELRVDPEHLWCDVVALDAALEARRYADAVELYRGPLLDGFFVSAAPGFEQWVAAERERCARAHSEALENLSEELTARGDLLEATGVWRRLAAHEPFNARIARRVMEALEAAGDPAGALEHARAHELRVREEFGAAPDPAVRAMAERLRVMPQPARGSQSPPAALKSANAAAEAAGSAAASIQSAAEARPLARRRGHALVLAGTIVLAGGSTLFALFGTKPALQPTDRILVAPFENRTGDPALDPFGFLAADWVTRAITETGLVEVVDPATALLTARSVDSSGARITERTRALSRESGAGIVITGSFYRRADSLEFHSRLVSAADGHVLRTIGPLRGPADDPRALLTRVMRRSAGAVAALRDARLATLTGPSVPVPSFDAYAEYVAGLERFVKLEYAEALPHFQRAVELDSSFVLPLIWMAFAYGNSAQYANRDSVVDVLASRRSELGVLDRHAVDYFVAYQRRDLSGALMAVRQAAELAPLSNWTYMAGFLASRLNRPREAIRALESLDPTKGWVKGWPIYWIELTRAYHMAGEHERELQAVQAGRRSRPDELALLVWEMRSLAALGRLADIERLREENPRLTAHPGFGEVLLVLGMELSGHGYAEAGRAALDQAMGWFRGPGEGRNLQGAAGTSGARLVDYYELLVARILYHQKRIPEAERLYREFLVRTPACAGWLCPRGETPATLGVLAAWRGDRATAHRMLGQLADDAEREPASLADLAYGQARIHAALGERERAVALLNEAWARSLPFPELKNLDPAFENLRGYPPFDSMLRPRD